MSYKSIDMNSKNLSDAQTLLKKALKSLNQDEGSKFNSGAMGVPISLTE